MYAFRFFLLLIILTATGAFIQARAPLWTLTLLPLLFWLAQNWAVALTSDSARPATFSLSRMLFNAYANMQFLLTGVIWLLAPVFWLRHGGGMLAALMCALALCAWILLYRRRWAYPLWVYQHAANARKFAALARELEQGFWQSESGSLRALKQFWSQGVWVNLVDATLYLAPLALLTVAGLEAHRLRSWLAFCLLILPALALLRVQLSQMMLAPTTAQGETHADHYHDLSADFAALDALDAKDAALVPDARAAEFLLRDASTDPELSAVQLLQRAVAAGDAKSVDRLLASGVNPNNPLPMQAADLRSPLVLAAISGQLAMIKRLIAGGAEVNGKSADLTPLLAATRDTWSGRFDVVMALLTNGADVHVKDRVGTTALHGAARSSDAALLQLLLDAGADTAVLDNAGLTPLACALISGQTANAQILLKITPKDSNLKDITDSSKALPLAHALAQCDAPESALIDLVIAQGNLDALDDAQETPLHRCARLDASEFAEALLAAGANASAKNALAQTPLMLAVSHASLRVMAHLRFAKPAQDALDQLGNSALHHAVLAAEARIDVLDQLLAMGVAVGLKNAEGFSAAELALRAGRWDLARRLSPEHELPEELEQVIDDASHVAKAPKREQLLIQSARGARFSVAQSLLALGSVDQHTHLQILLALGERLDESWLSALRAAGLSLGTAETEPVLCALARQCPPPENAMQLLLDAGASVAADGESDTPLLLLCGAAAELEGTRCPLPASPSAKLLAQLLSKGCDLGGKDRELRNALSYALQWCDLATVTLLLQAGNEKNLDLNARDATGQTPLLRALGRADSASVVSALIKKGADPNVTGRDGKSARAAALAAGQMGLAEVLSWPGDTHPGRALRDSDVAEAAARSDQQGVLRLLQLGYSIDAPDAAGFSALTHACALGARGLIEFLIENGAAVNGTEQVVTPLAAAVRARHFDIIRRLIALGADVNRPMAELSPLSLAAGLLDSDCCTLLLELGASLTPATPQLPPVHAALRAVMAGGDFMLGQKLLQVLIQRGADPDAIDSSGRAPLMTLVGANSNALKYPEDERLLNMLKTLLRLGANPQIRDNHQRGALHWCCRHLLFQAAEILLDAGADPMAVDEFRKLPVDMTTTLNRHDFMALFRGEGR
jgi:uncharacterized protein